MLKRLGGGRWNFVTFNINLWSIKESYFWFPRLFGFIMAMSLSGNTRDFLKISSHMFIYNKILKVFKSKISKSKNTSKYQISVKSMKGFRSYEYLKFRPSRGLKYRLWRHNYVIVVLSQTFLHQSWYLCRLSWSLEQ